METVGNNLNNENVPIKDREGKGMETGQECSTLKIAGIQMVCTDDPKKNLQKALNLINIAVEKGARIVCLQELFHTHWFPATKDERNFELAESLKGHLIRTLRKKAKDNSIVLLCPIFEKVMDGLYYNTTVVINKDGRILGSYRKNHLPDITYWEEGFYFAKGDLGFPVFHTKWADIGILMCWDNFFPEAARILALKGAQIIFCPTACAFASQKKWEQVIAANAINNGLFCFRVNRVGQENDLYFYGESFCVDPEGDFIAEPSGLTDAVVLANIDLGRIELTRRIWHFFKERRPEIYGEVIGEKLLDALNNLKPQKED